MGVQIPIGKGNFEGGNGAKYMDTVVICAKTAEPIEMLFGLWAQMGPKNHVLDGLQIPHEKGRFLGKSRPL